jgi:hypothetical protein
MMKRALDWHGDEAERTPWLTNGTGIATVKHLGDERFDFASVNFEDDRMAFAQGAHFVRQDIQVDTKAGLKARTRTYPTLGRLAALLTSSDAARSMMYPTLDHDPKAASAHLNEWLSVAYEIEPATTEDLKEIFPMRPLALRYWVGVRLDA